MTKPFISVDGNQPFLLPPDLREWVPEDDLVHFVIQAVESLPEGRFRVNRRGSGSAQYPPSMMLALLIYRYANGIFSSRIERATHPEIAVRFLTGDTHPDHGTIAAFRRENFDVVADCFVQMLELAKELKLLKVGTVSVDGTKMRANASNNRNVRYDRAGELLETLRQDVQELMANAEHTDQLDEQDGQRLPDELSRAEALREKLDAARKAIEERARARADVLDVLSTLIGERGTPRHIRSDNGTEFIAQTIREWLTDLGVETLYIAPGAPWQNGYVESFNSRLRDEFLEMNYFNNTKEATALTGRWKEYYNRKRPQAALGKQTPEEFARSFGSSGSASLRSATPTDPKLTLSPATP